MVGISNSFDVTPFGKFPDETASDCSVHLKLFAENTTGDAEDLWSFSKDLVVFLLLEEDLTVEFIFFLDLSPLLCLCLGSPLLRSLGTLRLTCGLLRGTLLCLFSLNKHSKLVKASNYQVETVK